MAALCARPGRRLPHVDGGRGRRGYHRPGPGRRGRLLLEVSQTALAATLYPIRRCEARRPLDMASVAAERAAVPALTGVRRALEVIK